jgi:7-keto-8-aminopelargonate synthetase-like enzyme
VVKGAADMVLEKGFIGLSISVARVCSDAHRRLEEELSELFETNAMVTHSCTAASEGILPLLACGVLTGGERPLMIFDRHCHFSMAIAMPLCGDETEVVVSPHNDLNFIEDMCRKYKQVAYVADGAYSMGGFTLMESLLELQDRYGLYLYLDDSHSLSLYGRNGSGFVRNTIGQPLNERTMITCSLAKAFGATGGVVMLGPNHDHEETIRRFAGPQGWSQNHSSPTLGAALASAAIHRSPELGMLQRQLKDRLNQFDNLIETGQKGNDFPIRLVPIGDEDKTVDISAQLFKRGFYSSAVFFPIVARGNAGIRVMLRATHSPEDLDALCLALEEVRGEVACI